MNLESQLTSFELSKKLKEIDIKQESIFFWYKKENCDWNIFHHHRLNILALHKKENVISAFTVAELMDIIPYYVDTKKNEPFNTFRFNMQICMIAPEGLDSITRCYLTNYKCDSTEIAGENAWLSRELFYHNIYDSNLADALAKTIIKLREDNLF